jgi:polygalacturonase
MTTRIVVTKLTSGLASLAILAGLTVGTQAQTLATGDSRSVSQPSNPTTCQTLTAQFTQSQRSSPPSSDDTSRLQTALTACKNTGHAVVLAASGSNNAFYSAELSVVGEAIVVDSGVVLYGNNSYSSQSELLNISGTNAGIYGPGAIDGRGDLSAISGTPRLVQASNVTNFISYNITLEQAKHPNLYIEGGNGATVWSTTIRTPATRANADGIDIDSITNVTVNQSSIEAGDDGIAVKTNSAAASNITVENTRIYGTHGLSIGSQTFDGVTNVLFYNDYVYGEDLSGTESTDANAINVKTDIDCGGLVQKVYYHQICITQAKHLIVVNGNYGSCSGTKGTPQFKNIVINGVFSQDSVSGAYEELAGYNSSNLAQVYVANIKLDSVKQSGDENATVFLDNVNGFDPSGSNVTTSSFTLSGSVPTCSF